MATKALFDQLSYRTSKQVTLSYSTSFSLGIKCLSKKFQEPIFNIYGFVRFADEIVDTFHDFDKATLLDEFRADTFKAIERKISLNPVLNSFQKTVNEYQIDLQLIHAFLDSMQIDLNQTSHTQGSYEKYIYGSAEVVGLMCLSVFCQGDKNLYVRLTDSAKKLGAAFQKINFLRDIKEDAIEKERFYFPTIEWAKFNAQSKMSIEQDIQKDFEEGYQGILALPKTSRFGVYLAYIYYKSLFNKIRRTPANQIMGARIRIPNIQKFALLLTSGLRHNLNLL